jgi:hypothetical protein
MHVVLGLSFGTGFALSINEESTGLAIQNPQGS